MQALKRLLLFFLFFNLLLLTTTLSGTAMATNADQELQDLKTQLKVLQQRIDKLETKQKKEAKKTKQIKNGIQTVYKKASAVSGLLEKYKIRTGAYLSSRYFALDRDFDDLNGADDSDSVMLNYLDLKLSANPTPDLQFHSTLTMYKLWGSDTDIQTAGGNPYNLSSTPSDSSIFVKRAYADYRPAFLKHLVNLEFGRLPTSGGYLTKYRYNRPSQTTYPDLAFNGESDGAALTLYLNMIPYLKTLTLVYTKGSKDEDDHPFTSDSPKLDAVNFYVVQLDSEIPFLRGSNFTAQWIRVQNLRNPAPEATKEAIADNIASTAMALGLVQDYEQSLFKTQVMDTLTVNNPEDFGYYDKLILQFDNERILGTPIDFFASIGWSFTHPNGDMTTYQTTHPSLTPLLGTDPLPLVSESAPYILSKSNQDKKQGQAVYLGLRLNIDINKLNNPKLGVEYNHGSRYWAGMNVAALDPYQKLDVRGDVWEIYWIQPFIKNKIQFRAGYQYIDRDYTDNPFTVYGLPTKVDETDQLFYVSLDLLL